MKKRQSNVEEEATGEKCQKCGECLLLSGKPPKGDVLKNGLLLSSNLGMFLENMSTLYTVSKDTRDTIQSFPRLSPYVREELGAIAELQEEIDQAFTIVQHSWFVSKHIHRTKPAFKSLATKLAFGLDLHGDSLFELHIVKGKPFLFVLNLILVDEPLPKRFHVAYNTGDVQLGNGAVYFPGYRIAYYFRMKMDSSEEEEEERKKINNLASEIIHTLRYTLQPAVKKIRETLGITSGKTESVSLF